MRKLLILLLPVFIISCTGNKKGGESAGNTASVSGTFKDGAGMSLVLSRMTAAGRVAIDSVSLDGNGRFTFLITPGEPDFFSLTNVGGNSITVLCKAGDSVVISGSYFNFREYSLTGTRDVELISSLNRKTQEFLDEMALVTQIVRDSAGSPDYPEIRQETDRRYRASFDSLKNFSERLILSNPESLSNILVLSNQLGAGFFVFHPVKDAWIFNRVDSILYSVYPGSEPVKNLHQQLLKLRQETAGQNEISLIPGDRIPDIQMPDHEKKLVSLSSLQGKTVLVCFWASWCKPCRELNREYSRLYEKYSGNTFDIYQVSFDSSEKEWKKAITEDRLSWPQLCDFMFWESKAASVFGIQNIPFNFLIDKNGEIISVNCGLEELEIKLDRIFNP